jgi:hypothetical protein
MTISSRSSSAADAFQDLVQLRCQVLSAGEASRLDETKVVAHTPQVDVGVHFEQPDRVDSILKPSCVHRKDLHREKLFRLGDRDRADVLDRDIGGAGDDLRFDPGAGSEKVDGNPGGSRRRTVANRLASSGSTSEIGP